MSQNSDVLVLGAGIIGLSIAYQIARRSNFSVTLIEKGRGLGEGSTGASSAILRHRYTHDEMVHLAKDGIDAYKNWVSFTGLSAPRARFESHGVLWMQGEDLNWSNKEHHRLAKLGIATQVLDDKLLGEQFPAINPCIYKPDSLTAAEHTCQGGGLHLLELDAGFTDPVNAAEDLLEAARREGVQVQMNARVERIDVKAGKVSGVMLKDGSTYHSACVVNALGPWCTPINKAAGVESDFELKAIRIQLLYVELPRSLPMPLPVCLDQGGVYFRTQNNNQQLVVGSTLESDELEIVDNPDELKILVDDEFKVRILHELHHRLPQLPYRGSVQGYCGLYTVNSVDVHPLVGETNVIGLYVANGFSGHGFKLAPAIGGLLARQITGQPAEFDTGVADAFLSPYRKPITGSKSVLA